MEWAGNRKGADGENSPPAPRRTSTDNVENTKRRLHALYFTLNVSAYLPFAVPAAVYAPTQA